MKRVRRSHAVVLFLLAALAAGCGPIEKNERGAADLAFGEDARVFVSGNPFTSIPNLQILPGWGTPGVNPERWHGGVEVFEKVAPATVVVRVGDGHGTGFIINEDGLVLTNHHVVATGTSVDLAEVASFCMVHLGQLTQQGRMELVDEPLRAFILAVDPHRDLALLELDAVPEALKPLPAVPFASANPRPGQPCLMIGHPSSGLLWSLRQGTVSGLGESPGDLVNVLLPLLASSPVESAQIEEMLRSSDSQDIVLSTCLANAGDSGGPLVDETGDLIGVTFGIPGAAGEQKFTYHVALNEVLEFLDQAGRTRRLLAPDAWNVGPMFTFLDPRVLAGGVDRPTQFMLDLDRDTPGQLIEDQDFAELVGRQQFDAEVVLHYGARPTAFYDTDNDGTIDDILIYSDSLEVAAYRFQLVSGEEWRINADVSFQWLDPSVLQDRSLQRTLKRMTQEFGLN